jgi:hypothetical protein
VRFYKLLKIMEFMALRDALYHDSKLCTLPYTRSKDGFEFRRALCLQIDPSVGDNGPESDKEEDFQFIGAKIESVTLTIFLTGGVT